MSHIHPTPESGKQFYQRFHDKGKIVMLNLLTFREVADYAAHPEIAPDKPISGREAYELYMQFTKPLLETAGSSLLFVGDAGAFVIGPEAEQWDLCLLVEHQSVGAFMAFANDPEYLKTSGHRTAALADSRLMPMLQQT